jgi:hypothetical protein
MMNWTAVASSVLRFSRVSGEYRTRGLTQKQNDVSGGSRGASRAVVVLVLLCLLLEVAAEVQTLCHSVISFSRQLSSGSRRLSESTATFRTIWEFAGVREHIMCGMSAGGAELSSLVSKADTVQATAEHQELMDPQTFHSRHTCSSSK